MARGLLTAVFVATSLHKLSLATEGSLASWHPISVAFGLARQAARALIAASAAVDLLVVLLLWGRPAVGGLFAAALVVCYTALASSSEAIRTSTTTCDCLRAPWTRHRSQGFWSEMAYFSGSRLSR